MLQGSSTPGLSHPFTLLCSFILFYIVLSTSDLFVGFYTGHPLLTCLLSSTQVKSLLNFVTVHHNVSVKTSVEHYTALGW